MKKTLLNRSIKPFHRDTFTNSEAVVVPVFLEPEVVKKEKKEKGEDAATN